MWTIRLLSFLVTCHFVATSIINFEEIGGKADDSSYHAALANSVIFNTTLNTLQPLDTFIIPNKTFTIVGGITASGLSKVTIQIDGTLSFTNDRDSWPTDENGNVLECIYLENIEDVIFTSTGKGTLDGNGKAWWGAIKFLKNQENRPRLFHMKYTKNIIVENLLFKDSPFWTFWAEHSDGLIVRHSDVDARWTNADRHTPLDLQAFNTDGFDVTGKNVHIHDCNIWNQDDCIAVKDDSEDMLFERISCSGLGLVIGSIGANIVRNITFRDCVMPHTFKGIYMKTRWSDGAPDGTASISDILYENITMDEPEQFAIWIGPAQQTGQPCSLLWPEVDQAACDMSGFQTWSNIVLRDITIISPKYSPGLLYGNSSNPIKGLVLDNVRVTGDVGRKPWGQDFYFCDGIEGGVAIGGTFPVPPCFEVNG
jgi:hypothetical protein